MDSLVLTAAAGALLFAAVGGLIARRRGSDVASGVVLGLVLGPIGWLVAYLESRPD